jgi:hypothetical protein
VRPYLKRKEKKNPTPRSIGEVAHAVIPEFKSQFEPTKKKMMCHKKGSSVL